MLQSASIKTISEVERKNEDLSNALAKQEEQLQAAIVSQTAVERDLNTALLQITSMGLEIQSLQVTHYSRSLFTTHYSLFTHYSLLTTHYSLLTHYSHAHTQ